MTLQTRAVNDNSAFSGGDGQWRDILDWARELLTEAAELIVAEDVSERDLAEHGESLDILHYTLTHTPIPTPFGRRVRDRVYQLMFGELSDDIETPGPEGCCG